MFSNESEKYLEDWKNSCISFEFYMFGICGTIVGIFGVVGNILSACVFIKPNMKSTVTTLILGQTTVDVLFLFLNSFFYAFVAILRYFSSHQGFLGFFHLVYRVADVVIDAMFVSSYYFTVAISLERMIAICWPVRFQKYCTRKRNRIICVIVLIIGIISSATFMYVHSRGDDEIEGIRNHLEQNCVKLTRPYNLSFEYRLQHEKLYFGWSYILMVNIIPTGTLIFANGVITWKLRQLRIKKFHNSSHHLNVKLAHAQSQEIVLTRMLLGMTIVSLLVQCSSYTMAVIEFSDQCVWAKWKCHLINFDRFLIFCNSSVNVIIYFVCGSVFRFEFISIIREFYTRVRQIFRRTPPMISNATEGVNPSTIKTTGVLMRSYD